MEDHKYPNPLRIRKKYVGKLLEKRKHSSPPINGQTYRFLAADHYPNVCKDDKSNQKKYDKWVDQQAKLDSEGFRLLASHYGVDLDEDDFFEQIAIHLCRDHVNFFQMAGTSSSKRNTDRQNSWTALSLQLLLVRVETKLREDGGTKSKAISAVANKHYGKAKNLRKAVNMAENLGDNKKTVKKMSREELTKMAKQLELYDRVAQLEYHVWIGDADEKTVKKYESLLEKISLNY
ncbi:MAG: hypothetical protein HOL77_20670 [Rhodobacteraceae bacterium]|jgi:hypothetical protein|nr:hypothetical protein [Paracoccaceae bacterium]